LYSLQLSASLDERVRDDRPVGPLVLLDVVIDAIDEIGRNAVDLGAEFRHDGAKFASDKVAVAAYTEAIEQALLERFALFGIVAKLRDQPVGVHAFAGLLQLRVDLLDMRVDGALLAAE